MPTYDLKQYPLATKITLPRTRRSVSARAYSLPKPYRRKRFVEDEPATSHTRIALLSLAGLTIGGLIAALALLARENLDSPPLLIVAAPRPAPARAALRPAAALARAAPAPAAALPQRPAPADAAPPAAAPHVRDDPAPAPRMARTPLPPPRLDAVAPDPDVVLIAAILSLTPPPAPALGDPAQPPCAQGIAGDNGCAALHGMEP